MSKRLLRQAWRGEKGITGLETAIILIAFVVVASVFAYTVLSAGLFSTQKSQQAVYAGLEEAQSTIQLSGVVVANGRAELDDMEYPLRWTPDADATLTRETTEKMQGSASAKVVIAAAMLINDEPITHAMEVMTLADGDTVSFFIKADATLDSNMSFHIATSADLSATTTESYVINTVGTGWEKHTFDLTGADDSAAAFFGIELSTDAEGTFYLDQVSFDDVASMAGLSVELDNMDYPIGWVADGDATVTRETTEVIEGNASISVVIATLMAVDDEPIYRAMEAKDWTDGDTITFWAKLALALDSDLTLHIGTSADLSTDATESLVINSSGTVWEKYTMTLSGGDDDPATFIGISLSTDDEGTFYIDLIATEANLSNNSDPMSTYANEVVFTISNALGGEPVDFTPTTDADNDGLISDEGTKLHKVSISYYDSNTQILDLAWSMAFIGKDDADNLLETSEKVQLTVDLTAVNLAAGLMHRNKVSSLHMFTLELIPHKGAVLILQRTLPIRVRDINNLN